MQAEVTSEEGHVLSDFTSAAERGGRDKTELKVAEGGLDTRLKGIRDGEEVLKRKTAQWRLLV